MRRHAEAFGGEIKHKWLEMLLAGGVGYYLPQTLAKLGVGYLAYNNVPMYRKAIDALYNGSVEAGMTGTNNPWQLGGIQGIGKTYGIADASYRVLEAAKKGKFGGGDLVKTSFDIGLVLDSVPGGSGGGSSGGGYW